MACPSSIITFCREKTIYYFQTYEPNHQIGGYRKIVEINEALIAKRKYNSGRLVEALWVFGGIERNTQGNETNTFYSIVPDRTAATLTNLIKQRIRRGTKNISDEWAGYHGIRALDMDYEHQTVNHSHKFVSPLDPNVHTQNIENSCKNVKRMLEMKGTNTRKHLEEYLYEFMYRKKFVSSLSFMVRHIAAKY
ncbi:hypothetical protein ROZALSC1DRAFT_16932 [Rozella allomycis CSF55]|uniref:ISXO2-like transposase domain-containing protein n=1 Tax=Rozella allomycis (strain CSF55) TaxID=988480 RepID=A0A4P9YFA5_ROZAC|nr:hypothetical protein ROZALSC1DRAFT_16932 [Rozella allomycis CSF55]